MSEHEKPTDDEQGDLSPTSLMPVGAIEQSNGECGVAQAVSQPAATAVPDLMVYVHAIRRNWIMALGIGLLCAGLAGPAVWFGVGPWYTASAYLRVAMNDRAILSSTDMRGGDRELFDIYKNTQAQLVLSRDVITSALKKPEVAKLPTIKDADATGDAVEWLKQRMSVGFPGRAELMEVSLTRRNDQNDSVIIVNEVVRAYLEQVVNVEQLQKRERLRVLDDAQVEKETLIRAKRNEQKNMAKELGTADTETLNMQQRLAVEQLAMSRQALARLQADERQIYSALAAQKALLDNAANVEINEADVDLMVQGDPVGRLLSSELVWQKLNEVNTQAVVVPGAKSRHVDVLRQAVNNMQQQFDALRTGWAAKIQQKKRGQIEMEVKKLEGSLAVIKEQENQVQLEVERQVKEAEKFGSSTVDLEMLREEIKIAGAGLTVVAGDREKLLVDVNSPPRVIPLQSAQKPETASNFTTRLALTVLAALAGLCCPAGVVALWDARAKRINNCADVSTGLRLPVIGAVPLIPARVIRHLGSPAKRYQIWQLRLTESVDGVAARVLRKAHTQQCRVLMVSSAMGGEGKTTLATQLAMSLARAGRRTVLVDCDLRQPAFDEAFDLPLEPGVCEALRQGSAASVQIHRVATENLSVVTAGRWDRNALAALSNGAAAPIFEELREAYEFVVVDTSPILPVADARFVSQHVDAVILSVLRDVSQAPKIQAACEVLSAFGVQNVEAVVTGPNQNLYGRHMVYPSTISA